MPRLNVFIDGSWLFKVCQADGVLSKKTERETYPFPLDFSKLSSRLLAHAQNFNSTCSDLGDLYFSTSIFELPTDFDDWPNRFTDVTSENIEKTRKNVSSRDTFAQKAMAAGFKSDAIYRPPFKKYMLQKLITGKFQEKMVDTSVVALLVRSAITVPGDFHVVITGDSDILPAIKVAYPQYSKNVIIATTHPDELRAEHRQTAYSFTSFDFSFDPFYFQDHVKDLIEGSHVYQCNNCSKVLTRLHAIPRGQMPYCSICRP